MNNQEDAMSLIISTRKAKRITQDELAMHLGITTQSYWAYEKCKSRIPLDSFLKIIRYLNLSLQDFIISEDEIIVSTKEVEELKRLLELFEEKIASKSAQKPRKESVGNQQK